MISECTIHMSQVTYDEMVYEYNITRPIQLLYVTPSWVTSAEDLFIHNFNDNLKFYYGMRIDTSVLSL